MDLHDKTVEELADLCQKFSNQLAEPHQNMNRMALDFLSEAGIVRDVGDLHTLHFKMTTYLNHYGPHE